MPLFVKKPAKNTKLIIFFIVILTLLAGSYFLLLSADASRQFQEYDRINISFLSNPQTTISAWLADTPAKQMRGLSGVDGLRDDQGMLFSFEEQTDRVFWMKGMKIPIDIIWMRDDIVVRVDANVHPEPGKTDSELTQHSSGQAVDSVLEVRAGWASNHNIGIGNAMTYVLD